MDSIILNLSNFTDQIQRENLAGALDSTLMNLNAILARVNAGEGTVGQLVSDPRLYESLNEATANLASLLANLQAHPARYVHFSLFGRDPERPTASSRKRGETCPARFAQGPESGPIVSNVFSVR